MASLDYGLLTPEFLLLGLIFLVLALDLVFAERGRWLIPWVAIVGLLVVLVVGGWTWGIRATFADLLRVDEYTSFFRVLFAVVALGVVFVSMPYVPRFLPHQGEYYALVLAGTLGMVFMAMADELLTAYISLELLSFSSYILVSYAKRDLKSNEAGIKYLIIGGLSSALLLYGISLLYGATGTTKFPAIAQAIQAPGALDSPGLLVALALITVGLGFKVAAVPFHMWTPDVYEGAPTPIAAYLAVGSKAAGFALVVRFLVGGLLPAVESWLPVFAVLAVLTMTVGNLVAIHQRNLKRLLAYSSISQAGYVLVGIAALQDSDIGAMATRGIVLHLAGYVFTNLAAFGALIAFESRTGRTDIRDLAGVGRQSPFIALTLMVSVFSLAGMPLFAGFVTKFYLFAAAARADLLWLVAIAVINSTISLYYYLIVVKEMYVGEARPGLLSLQRPQGLLTGIALAAGVVAGIVVWVSLGASGWIYDFYGPTLPVTIAVGSGGLVATLVGLAFGVFELPLAAMLAGVFVLGLYPYPVLDLLGDVSNAVFTATAALS